MTDDELQQEAEWLTLYLWGTVEELSRRKVKPVVRAALRRVADAATAAERQRCAAIADYWHTVCARKIRGED